MRVREEASRLSQRIKKEEKELEAARKKAAEHDKVVAKLEADLKRVTDAKVGVHFTGIYSEWDGEGRGMCGPLMLEATAQSSTQHCKVVAKVRAAWCLYAMVLL